MHSIMNKYTTDITSKCVKSVADTVAVRALVLQLGNRICENWDHFNRYMCITLRVVSLGI